VVQCPVLAFRFSFFFYEPLASNDPTCRPRGIFQPLSDSTKMSTRRLDITYQTGPRQFTSTTASSLTSSCLSCGMPQGSSFNLGPKACITYAEDVDSVSSAHRLVHHSFADDIPAHEHTVPSQASTIVPSLQRCIADVAGWRGSRRPQLNSCGSAHQRR